MSTTPLNAFSNALADTIDAVSPSVVQAQGHRRPATGLVYADDVVVTMVRALGREDGLHVRRQDGRTLEAELVGWDLTTNVAVLRAPGLELAPIVVSATTPRVGHLAAAVARSWSNAVTASLGIVSVIGGPLRTGRRRSIEQVIRTTAPMHDGFSGGAFINPDGELVGMTTATAIRGLGLVIPSSIVWKTAGTLLEHGRSKRGYLGIASQSVPLPEAAGLGANRGALLVSSVTTGSPAAAAGVLLGDVIFEFDGNSVESPDDLLDLLAGDRVGRQVPLKLLRAGAVTALTAVIGERPTE